MEASRYRIQHAMSVSIEQHLYQLVQRSASLLQSCVPSNQSDMRLQAHWLARHQHQVTIDKRISGVGRWAGMDGQHLATSRKANAGSQ
jgi:hypothetical protein